MRIAEGCVDRAEDFGLLVKAPSGNHFVLNETGTAVWCKLREGDTSEEDLTTFLVMKFGIELEMARSDLRSLLQSLQRYGLLLDWQGGAVESVDDAGSTAG